MPKRKDIHSILVLGAGPIVIGQACEFDYAGVQACKALKEEGYRVILVNSNPATIMTDPDLAHATYIEPVKWEVVVKIIQKERPDALLPTMGGQTGLNCSLDLASRGVLEIHNVKMIGATREAIDKAEDRELFDKAMKSIGLETPRAGLAHSMEECLAVQKKVGFPCIIRPSFTLGGSGGGIAYNIEEFIEICQKGLDLSPTNELLIDESLIGWKEYEMEVVRDNQDNCLIVCSIENLDPMGVHTGDSITVAPAQTLTDKEFQRMRDASMAVLREIGVETGGSNVQFAIHPTTGRMVVIEMNPRVSRSSALASKATGFPIAKVAAKLAVGYTLDELKNEVTGGATPISFEPALDYIVTKIPRFNFDKFPQSEPVLTTQMRSVGEVMAIGRTFKESFQKALCSLETGSCGMDSIINSKSEDLRAELIGFLRIPGPERIWFIGDAFRHGFSVEEVHRLTAIDPWFLRQIEQLIQTESTLASSEVSLLTRPTLRVLKRQGFSDCRLASLLSCREEHIRSLRHQWGIVPVYKRVDTCAAEFPASTAYLYSTYEEVCEAAPSKKKKIMILGGGPNRIGQGLEFDYCCVHAAFAMREDGYETIMVNCNPETVSTDFDTSDRLYFEPVTLETTLEIVNKERPDGVIVHYGGQTPLKLAQALGKEGVPIIGTPPDAIDCAEDRGRFQAIINQLGLAQPPNATALTEEEGLQMARRIGFPLVVRPSYVLGGQAMEIVYNEDELLSYLHKAMCASPDAPILLDHFLDDAIEVDIDAICDGSETLIAGIMEHIEQAGIHSGDSACALPAHSLSSEIQKQLARQMSLLAQTLNVRGLVNAQFAIQGERIFVLEVNPRASRTVPFVSKAIGLPLAKIAARVMTGRSLKDQGISSIPPLLHYCVKEPVFPFEKFPKADPLLGPQMKSTGEAMGIGPSFGEAFYKAKLGGLSFLPQGGSALLSVKDSDKSRLPSLAASLTSEGFEILGTAGSARVIRAAGIPCRHVNKVREGRPHIVDLIKNRVIHYIVNTTEGKSAISDSYLIRRSALRYKIPYTTTVAGAEAACQAMRQRQCSGVIPLQVLHKTIRSKLKKN